jgi:FHA domain
MKEFQDEGAKTDLVEPTARDAWELIAVFENHRVVKSLTAPCEIVIGRDQSSDVAVPHTSVSRRHARLVIRETATIEDLGSSNGIRIDGRKIAAGEVSYVRQGAFVELGDVVLLVRPPSVLLLAAQSDASLGVGSEMSRVFEFVSRARKVLDVPGLPERFTKLRFELRGRSRLYAVMMMTVWFNLQVPRLRTPAGLRHRTAALS